MEIVDLLQLIRTCNLHQVMQQLELAKKKQPDLYNLICAFYLSASKKPLHPPHPSRK